MTEKTYSRQYLWQLKKQAQGLCKICGKEAVTKAYCEKHRLSQNEFGRRYRAKKKQS